MGIFLLVSAITALSVYAIEQVETQRAEAQYRQMAVAVTGSVERLANANAAYLRAGAALLATRPEVRREDFHQFAEQMMLDETLRAGGALVWAPRIARADVPALEQRMRAEGYKNYTVHPASDAPWAMPATFVEPDVPANRNAYGYDSLADPIRQAAVDRSVTTGKPSATPPVTLVVDSADGHHKGFGIIMPVYDRGGGDGQVKGILGRAFNADKFIDAALRGDQFKDYGIAIYDGETLDRDLLVSVGPQAAPARVLKRTIMLANRRMLLELSPPSRTTLSNLSLLTLFFGMMGAALLLVVARLVTQQAAEDRAALAWFEEQASIRNSLTRELNHRVKNTLANVLSIVALTRRRTDNLDDFVSGLMGRVRALSATHDLLTQSEWGTTPIGALVAAELAPYAQGSDQTVTMRGPHVELAPNDALSLGLAIHELATNASKYGALSVPFGRVEIVWGMMTDKLARLEWREEGGPPVPAERRRGFGTELIEKIVAHELRNPVNLTFDAEGVRCTLIVPVRTPVIFKIRAPRNLRVNEDAAQI